MIKVGAGIRVNVTKNNNQQQHELLTSILIEHL